MTQLTRRGFFWKTSAGVATVGGLAAVFTATPRLATVATSAKAAAQQSATTLSGPLVAYVKDAASGTVSVMVGEREFVHHDPDLVARLSNAAK
jgi:3-hydroxyisobutyrate dehydrogenase-like beta-hydroxyacid dehydrogenase